MKLVTNNLEEKPIVIIDMGQSKGTISYIPLNDIISETGEVRVIDGITTELQMTPDTEAPVETNTWFPDKKALWVAENRTGTLHNLYKTNTWRTRRRCGEHHMAHKRKFDKDIR